MNHKLIVTADDYGMCNAVNEAIEECLAAGTLHAACVMTNMIAYDAAASLPDRFPQASVGIHWNLTIGQPVLSALQVPSLVGPDGRLHSFSEFRRGWLTGQVRLAEFKAELRAQYQCFYDLAGVPDFWNTHENVHLTPGLFHVCVALGQEFGIPAMRCHRRITVPRHTTPTRYNLRHPLYWLKGQVISWWSSRAEARGVLMPDGTIDTPGFDAGKAAIEEVVKRIQWPSVKNAVELVIHPATAINEALFGELTESRLHEYRAFSDPELANRLAATGVETAGFEAVIR